MDESILKTIKQLVGMEDDEGGFDTDVVTYINTVFSELNQLGAGPPNGYFLKDGSECWEEFTNDLVLMNLVKTYIGNKVRLRFDPPASTALLQTIKEDCMDLQWRIIVQTESGGPIPIPPVEEN